MLGDVISVYCTFVFFEQPVCKQDFIYSEK